MLDERNAELAEKSFKAYRHMMYKIAFDIVHNKSDAEDAVQNCFMWIMNNIEKISQIPLDKRGRYFAEIAEHISINIVNKRKKHPTEDIDEHEEISTGFSVEKSYDDGTIVEEVRKAVDAMSATDRSLLRLYLFEERSSKEIAGIMGISEVNARVGVFRARKRLAKLLKERGIDYEY